MSGVDPLFYERGEMNRRGGGYNEEEEEGDEEDLFEDHVSPYYLSRGHDGNHEVIRDYLAICTQKAALDIKNNSNQHSLDNFIPDKHPLDQDDDHNTKEPAFWEKYTLDKKTIADLFTHARDYKFTQPPRNTNSQLKSRAQKNLGSFANSRNLVDDDVFDGQLQIKMICCIMDSAEFMSIFCDLSILKGQNITFNTFPDDMVPHFFHRGLHYIRMHKETEKRTLVQFSIDPAFKIKIEEKKDRKEERKERRVIRAMLKEDRLQQKDLPATRSNHNRMYDRCEKGATKVGGDGDIMSDSSSDDDSADEDSIESVEQAKFQEYVTGDSVNDTSNGIHEADRRDFLLEGDEVFLKLKKLSEHVKDTSSFNLGDYNIRQFLDVYLRILVIFHKKIGGGYGIEKFVFYIPNHSTKNTKKK
jgi:hypothetical protein